MKKPNSNRTAVGFLLGALVGVPAWGQTGCEEVPEASRAQCEKVLDCMAIENAVVRRVCIAAAQGEAEDEDAPRDEPAIGQKQEPEQGQPAPAPQPPPREQPEREAEPVLQEQTIGSRRPAPTERTQSDQPADLPLAEPPESFTGEITRVHQSVLERQVIALDNRYVFVSDQAAQARLKRGQMVEAKKARSRFREGRTWRLVGPSRRPIDAFRVRCELDDLGKDDRRRCERMLDR